MLQQLLTKKKKKNSKLVAIVTEAEAALYCSFILHYEQKLTAYKRTVPSSIYSKPSEVNKGQIKNVTRPKKELPEEKRLE